MRDGQVEQVGVMMNFIVRHVLFGQPLSLDDAVVLTVAAALLGCALCYALMID